MSVTVQYFNKFMENLGKGIINLNSDSFSVILVNGYTFDGTDDTVASLGAVELPTGYGYVSGGASLNGITYAYDGLNYNTKWDAGNITWTASGGNIGPATGAVIIDNTVNRVILYINFGGPQTATEGSEFKLLFHNNGILTFE